MKKTSKTTKKHRSSGRSDGGSSSPDPSSAALMDRRLMDRTMLQLQQLLSQQDFKSADEANAYLQGMLVVGDLPELEPLTTQQEAQELMFTAFEADGKKRIELARRALSIDPDCVDAYCLLAEETATLAREELRLYREAVDAGERSLGAEIFAEQRRCFWGIVETRPYMRAMMGLAFGFHSVGQRDDAISTWQRMIELNPGDNQGVRDILVSSLLREGRTEEAGALLRQYDDATAGWAFSKALWLFQKEGASSAAERALSEAARRNQHVIPFLTGERPVRPVPGLYSLGGVDEAIVYVSEALATWHSTTGAVRWLCRFAQIDDSTA